MLAFCDGHRATIALPDPSFHRFLMIRSDELILTALFSSSCCRCSVLFLATEQLNRCCFLYLCDSISLFVSFRGPNNH